MCSASISRAALPLARSPASALVIIDDRRARPHYKHALSLAVVAVIIFVVMRRKSCLADSLTLREGLLDLPLLFPIMKLLLYE